MVGNVSEWTLDVYRSNYSDSYTDSRMYPGFTTFEVLATARIPNTRVLRGGSWIMGQSGLSVTKRHYGSYSIGAIDHGIRLVSTLCGNGIIDGNEVCDDGNSELFDGCNFFC
jgi:cysteine-rich repeat protein